MPFTNRKFFLIIVLVFGISVVLYGAYIVTPRKQSDIYYGNITVEQSKELIEIKKSLVILDVRTLPEFNSGHIQGAINIPISELEKELDKLNRNDEILVYCRLGVRSTKAMKILNSSGFLKVFNMLGGIEAWKQKGYSIVK